MYRNQNHRLFSFLLINLSLFILNVISVQNYSINATSSDHSKGELLINNENKIHQLVNKRFKRAANSKIERKWPNAIIPYEIEPYLFKEFQLSLFKEGMLFWENNTCVKFVERTNEDDDYVLFTIKPCRCCSMIGRNGGRQDISFDPACTKLGTVLHELGHLVGFWHEHTRPDRDRYVTIIYSNIKDGQLHNFDKMNKSDIDSFGSPYDFDSIMHYKTNTFSKDPSLDTIRPKLAIDNEIGQREHLSKQDISQTNLLYKCPMNGQTIQQSRGFIELNQFADENKIDKDPHYYEWRFVAKSISEHIMLRIDEINFNDFDNSDCNENYVLILDGYQISSSVIRKFCVNSIVQLPLKLNSKTNRMMIIYKKSKRNISGNLVLKAYYEFQCGGHLIDKEGIIQSPNYPMPYPMSNCQWTIHVEPNHKIILKFMRFNLQNSLNCETDYLEIRDGLYETSGLIKKICGSTIQNTIMSSKNEMFIRFVSHSIVPRAGFNITYISDLDECEQKRHECDQLCINVIGSYKCDCMIGYEIGRDGKTCVKSCGGIITLNEKDGIQTLTSPDYPNDYRNFLNCKWELRAPPNFSIFLNFTDFDLEENIDCQSDTLTIKSKMENENLPIIHGRYCGSTKPASILSKSNVLLLDFKTDKSDTRRGFSINYQVDRNECQIDNGECQHICINKLNDFECQCENGFLLNPDRYTCKQAPCVHNFSSSKGSFQSINFQNPNIADINCSYAIQTLPGHLIKIKIKLNESFPTKQCLKNIHNLIVYDGSTSKKDHVLYKFKDNDGPRILTSTKNSMYITYFSNSQCPNPGFHLSYINVCVGKTYWATKQQNFIYSHPENGLHAYKSSVSCKWIIKSKSNRHVRIKIVPIDIEDDTKDDTKCFDSLKIYEGSNEDANKLIENYCGNRLSEEHFISEGNSLLIKFITDIRNDTNNERRNFSAFMLFYDEIDHDVLNEYSN